MVPRRLYRLIGEKLSVIGLGTWAIRDYDTAFSVIVKGVLEYGINSIDTAEIYGGGLAEELVGRVAAHVGRDEVFVTTKLPPRRLESREEALRAARRSLQRLGFKEVDLLLIHWPHEYLKVPVMIRNLEAIAEAGYARFIGVSNFDKSLLEEAMSYTRKYDIVADQIHYSIHYRAAERESLIEYAGRRGIMVQAYQVIERGGVIADQRLRELAKSENLSPVKLAIAYVINKCDSCMALVKTESPSHLREIAEASSLRISGSLLQRLSTL